MTDNRGCREIELVLPEIALGIATGEDRAVVLDHVSRCSGCRRRLEELSEVADELMLLVPGREPPVGFESRVSERMAGLRAAPGRRSGKRRWRRLTSMALAAVLTALATFGGVWVASASLRDDAEHYRTVLTLADGTYFGARPLLDAAGRQRGFVFSYAGEPSWFVLVARRLAPGATYDVEIVSRTGAAFPLGTVTSRDGTAVFGSRLPIPPRAVARLRVADPDGSGTLEVVYPPPPADAP